MPPSYMGTFMGVRKYVMSTFANTQSALMKKRVSQFMISTHCPECKGKRLRRESLSVKFSGLDITEMSRLPMKKLAEVFAPFAQNKSTKQASEKMLVAQRIAQDLSARLQVLLDLGLGYLTLERSTPGLSPGELQRLRLATQVYSNLFGVVYVLDEPSAGLHPSDTEALLRALDRLKAAGNSIFVVEHELEIIRHADWIVDVGPMAGEKGGEILYSGPLHGLKKVQRSQTRLYLDTANVSITHAPRTAKKWLKLQGITRNNLQMLDADIPLGVFTSVTGISGSGKSSLVSQVLVELVAKALGQSISTEEEETEALEKQAVETLGGKIASGIEAIGRLVVVDQKPIGRTPRSNLATYTGLFDQVRKIFASTKMAKTRRYDAGRFSFNVAKGRCEKCEGEGFVMVELLFLPSVYAPCPVCKGTRYNAQTLEVLYKGKSIADVLGMTVDEALEFFSEDVYIHRVLTVVHEVGLGYLRLGQSATELSGGEAQRIKLATELHRTQKGDTLYVLDEPTTGLHPHDVQKLLKQLHQLVEAGNTVVVVEHDMHVVASGDWVIDMGPGAGDEGGHIVFAGVPQQLAKTKDSKTAPYLLKEIKG